MAVPPLPSAAPEAAGAGLALSWWPAGLALLVLASLGAVAAAESSARRRERLGLVLRVGAG